MKPFLKWVGGKTQIIDDVMDLFPRRMNNYHEPFIGGGSVLLALLSSTEIVVHGHVYASDANSNLIWLYKNIQKNPDALIDQLKQLTEEFAKCEDGEVNRKAESLEEAMSSPESYYFWIRKKFNELPEDQKSSVSSSAMCLFLNKTCFRGLYREGPNGFNVPFGNYKTPSIYDEVHIRQVSRLIQNVIFTACGFEKSLSKVIEGDFVYLDPPYAETSFTKYISKGFTVEEHKKLFEMCKELPTNMLMSNADVDIVKDAFPTPAYTTKILSCKRSINNTKTNEVLIKCRCFPE